MSEQEFYSDKDISVTTTRVIIGEQTYAMNGITSVRAIEEKPSRKGPIILGILGIFPLFSGEIEAIMLGFILIGLAILWFFKKKSTFYVGLVTAAGEKRAFHSTNENVIRKVVDAINEAIIARG